MVASRPEYYIQVSHRDATSAPGRRALKDQKRSPGSARAERVDAAPADPMDASGRGRTIDVASLATSLASAVLDGDQERAKTIARTILEQETRGPDAPV